MIEIAALSVIQKMCSPRPGVRTTQRHTVTLHPSCLPHAGSVLNRRPTQGQLLLYMV